MGILTTKIFRDIWYSKGRSFSIIFIVAVSTALYGGLILSHENIKGTFDGIENTTKFESVRFMMPNYTDPQSIDLSSFSQYLTGWEYRLSVVTGMRVTGKDTTFTLAMFGVEPGHRPTVNDFIIEKGDYFTTNDANQSLVLMTTQFMTSNKLKIGDSVQVQTPSGLSSASIKAKIYSNEYIYNVNPKTGLPDISGLAAGWFPLSYVQSQFGLKNKINEVVVRYTKDVMNNDALKYTVTQNILSYLKTKSTNVSYLYGKDEPEQKFKAADVGTLDDFARIFGLIIMMIALFVIYDNVSKLISSQRNYIGTMRALGGSKRVVAYQYTMIGVILGIFGVLIGIPLGWLIGKLMTESYSSLLYIPSPSTRFRIGPFSEAIIVNLALVSFLSLLSARSAVQINPMEAMSSSFITMIYTKKPWLEKVFSKIPGFNTPTGAIPVRSLSRHRRKTLITILTFAISIVLMLSAMAFMDSFNHGISDNYNNYEKYDLQVYFLEPMSITQVDQVVNTLNYVTKSDGFTSLPIQITNNDKTKNTVLYGFNSSSQLRHIKLKDGQFTGLTLGVSLANYLGVGKGDTVNISGFQIPVAAISDELLSDSAMVPLNIFQYEFQLGNNVTGILLNIADGYSVNQVKDLLMQTGLPIGLMLSTNEVIDSINALMQGLLGMVAIMIVIGFLIVALFSFNTIVLDIMGRQNEFVNIRSLGGSRRHVMKIIAFQGLVISILGSIIAIPLGYLVSDYTIQALIGDVMVLPTVLTPTSYAVGIFSAYIASLFGIFAAYRYIMKIKLVDALRTRISN